MLVPQSCPALCDPTDCSPPAPRSMGFLRQEYWRGLPFPSPGDLPHPGIKPGSPALAGGFLTAEPSEQLPPQCLPSKFNMLLPRARMVTQSFTSALSVTAWIWKQPKYPSAGERINKCGYSYSKGLSWRHRRTGNTLWDESQVHRAQGEKPDAKVPHASIHGKFWSR